MCTHNIPFFIIKKKNTPDYCKSVRIMTKPASAVIVEFIDYVSF